VPYGELVCNTECIMRDLRSSGMLRNVDWQVVTDWLNRDVGNYIISQESEDLVHGGVKSGITQCMTIQTMCLTNRGRYNRVQLYLVFSASKP